MEPVSSPADPSRTSPSQVPVTTTVTVEHALDLAEVDVLRTALMSALSDRRLTPGGTVVLDMAGCDYVDMTGYRLLHEAAGTVDERGLVLHLTRVRPEVVRILARLDALLQCSVQRHALGGRSTTASADGPGAGRSTQP